MVRKFYGLTGKQLAGMFFLVAVVMSFVIFFIPITVIEEDRNGRIVEMSRNLIEVLLTPDVDIEIDVSGTGGDVLCIELFDPVCGVDRQTYSNSCFAGQAGVEILHVGECTGSEPSIFCQIYPSACP